MKEYNINLKINNEEFNTKGKLINDMLIFNNQNIKYEYNIKKNILIKEDKETKLVLDFNKNILEFTLKEETHKIKCKFKKNLLINKTSQVIINYQVEQQVFSLKLTYK